MTVDIDMGVSRSGGPANLDLEELLATRLLVQGNSGSGKSHLLRRLLEKSAPWVQQCIIDPEGDFVTLADRFDHVVVEADRSESELTKIAGRMRQHRVSAVLSLEGLEADAQMRAAAAFMGGLFDAERDHWYPMLVVVDEAQLFAPAAAGEVSDEARKVSLGAMTNLMCRGRKRGLAGVIATQRLAKLAKNVAAEASNFLMGRTFLDIDMARAGDLLGMDKRATEMFRDLERGHFVALGPALSRRPLPIVIGPVETSARSTSPKLMPLPEARGEDAADLLFTASADEPVRAPAPRRSHAPQPRPEAEILAQLSAAARTEEAPSLFPDYDVAERDAQIDQVLAEILDDSEAAFRSVAVLYQDFLVRCRIRRVPGTPPDLAEFKRRFAVARAGVSQEVAGTDGWQTAQSLAATLSEDVRGVFLVLARAALEGEACPSDAALARAYGSHSTGRARRLVTYFEERDLIVLREDFSGRRIIAFPELGCETAPGDPNRHDDGPARAAAE
ncbi:ATP-binding protein [Pelagibacterium montanilacus]|uniref:ATP-binding protein n=1 Tax=Pelagibacterium montanilacus TaxID=2185280 RepID=UPI000F8F3DFE|nr:ATP-binding protein [Pelagibacterium montanilacus]